MWFFSCGLQYQRLVVLKNNIELGQFQSNSPRYLPISEEFWKALAKLPAVYDYAAYRKVLERFGTHYRAAGSLGGSFSVVARIDEETQTYMSEREQVLSVIFCRVVCISICTIFQSNALLRVTHKSIFPKAASCLFFPSFFLLFPPSGWKQSLWGVWQDQTLDPFLPPHYC